MGAFIELNLWGYNLPVEVKNLDTMKNFATDCLELLAGVWHL